MYSDRRKKRGGLLALVLALLLLAGLTAAVFGHSGRDVSEEGAAAIRETVRRNALQCRIGFRLAEKSGKSRDQRRTYISSQKKSQNR